MLVLRLSILDAEWNPHTEHGLEQRQKGCQGEDLDELSRELQMALSTAKWQEFEKAICMSHRSHRDDITVSRHSQFVSVVEDQISRVEAALKESFQGEGKKELHKCDDLALFLSGSTNLVPQYKARMREGALKKPTTMPASNISFYADRNASNRRTWSPSHRDALEIVIDKDDRQNNADIEATPKEKCTKPFFWNSRDGCQSIPYVIIFSVVCFDDDDYAGMLERNGIVC
ncbi:hypothetical protein SASPL_127146 [Salvia splendens]|uniref:Syntaxin 6 N-terminal domain-containing protein n=1 Tax=Salvia splendens TaxID=180675 RepID=A0A8X8XK45_SALSN|nr:hypothetical protein SASPL_127146 [Salvia splendens]